MKALIKPGWLHVPVRPAVRISKQSSYYYNYSNTQKFENKDGIPRLFWFRRDEPLLNVFEHIIKQYTFAFAATDPEEYYTFKYKPLMDYIARIDNNDPEDIQATEDFSLNQDETVLPMIVNIINQHYEANKYSYNQPPCPACEYKYCKNCPMPAVPSHNLGQLLSRVTVDDA